MPYNIIIQFEEARKKESRSQYIEKKKLGFFELDSIMHNKYVHKLSKESIRYFLPKISETYLGLKKMWPIYARQEDVLSIGR